MSRKSKKERTIWPFHFLLFDEFGFWLPANRTGVVIGEVLERNVAVIDISADTADPFCIICRIFFGKISWSIFRTFSFDNVMVVGIGHGGEGI